MPCIAEGQLYMLSFLAIMLTANGTVGWYATIFRDVCIYMCVCVLPFFSL